jgi:hypothetical protein
VFNDFIQTRVHAQKTITERQSMRTRRWALLDTFRKTGNSDLDNPAILKPAQRFRF